MRHVNTFTSIHFNIIDNSQFEYAKQKKKKREIISAD